MNDLGSGLEMERLGRLKARFPRHQIERFLSPASVWGFMATPLDGGIKVSALTVASLERKLKRQTSA